MGKGQRLTGIINDASAKIDFVAWNAKANQVHQQIKEGETYKFNCVKVATCKENFCNTPSGLQLVIGKESTIEKRYRTLCCGSYFDTIK